MLSIKSVPAVDTPFYFYDLQLLNDTLKAIKESSNYPGFKVHYAVKANANPQILRQIAGYGYGADTVSAGEIRLCLECGFRPENIVFAGVGKTDAEIEYALKEEIGCLNVESVEELKVISEIAQRLGVVAPIALRVNPNIDAHTHHYITTGLKENKFGIDIRILDQVVELSHSLKGVTLLGLHFHIGSQVTTMAPYKLLCKRINSLIAHYLTLGIEFKYINVGGGLGIDYDNPDINPIADFKSYFNVFAQNLKLQPYQELHFELGRAVVAQCGSLISKAIYVKNGIEKKFVILDAGFTELIRPALYQAHHAIQNLSAEGKNLPIQKYDVVGPICESTDVFAENEMLPETKRGDIIAIRSAGAYGESMASQYNCRNLVGSYFSSL